MWHVLHKLRNRIINPAGLVLECTDASSDSDESGSHDSGSTASACTAKDMQIDEGLPVNGLTLFTWPRLYADALNLEPYLFSAPPGQTKKPSSINL
jgi:hypothetical protein